MSNLALLVLRATTGTLVAGHGAQKLFGWFNGPGMEGTDQMMESLGLSPGRRWAMIGGSTELGGGLLTLLGWLNPLGPVGVVASMTMAGVKAHGFRPIWVTEGGAEFPVTNMAIASAMMLSGPGKYSLDNALGTRIPRWVGPIALLAALLTIAFTQDESQEESSQEQPSERDGAEQAYPEGE